MHLTLQQPLSALLGDDALDHAIWTPQTTRLTELPADEIEAMGCRQIWHLPAFDEDGTLVGLLHLHPAMEAPLWHGASPDKPPSNGLAAEWTTEDLAPSSNRTIPP